jgi:hypothetical protein
MRQAEAGTGVAESSWCPTPAHTPSHGQADIQTHCSLMMDVLKDLSTTLIRLEHMCSSLLYLLSFWGSAKLELFYAKIFAHFPVRGHP